MRQALQAASRAAGAAGAAGAGGGVATPPVAVLDPAIGTFPLDPRLSIEQFGDRKLEASSSSSSSNSSSSSKKQTGYLYMKGSKADNKALSPTQLQKKRKALPEETATQLKQGVKKLAVELAKKRQARFMVNT
ncbi:hypothetical protein V8C86DRAFT_3150671 [Haematococcus lacustris]